MSQTLNQPIYAMLHINALTETTESMAMEKITEALTKAGINLAWIGVSVRRSDLTVR